MSHPYNESPPPRVPPHIRLNSGTDDLLNRDINGSSRSLMPWNSRQSTANPQPQYQAYSAQPQSQPFASQNQYQPYSAPIQNAPQFQPYSASTELQPYSHVSQPLQHLRPSRESFDRLLPPPPSQHGPTYARPQSPLRNSGHSSYSSRRSSWESGRSRQSHVNSDPFQDPETSRPGSRAASEDDEEDLNTQTVAQKYNILPSEGLLLYPEDVEKDDYLHNPDPKGESRDCNIFTKRGVVNVGGLVLFALGLLFLFIGYPVLTFVRKLNNVANPCASNPDCIPGHAAVPLLKNIRTGLIDPDTPSSAQTVVDYHGNTWNLAFSDEFSTPGRTFYEGDDPYFAAVDIWYGVTGDVEWYDPDAATTGDGVLQLKFDQFANHGLNYRSAMIQSWNQLCFKGGRIEASISLPGRGDVSGLWPGFWSMGNLGRPGYAATTEGLWPYSYSDTCDAGITPNQSSPDGISWLPGMKLPACSCLGEDHPTPGKSRSAPEIDVVEGTVGKLDAIGNLIGTGSQSFQVAPFDIWYQPNYDFVSVTDDTITTINEYRGGPYQQALSGLTNLNNNWYDGNEYQTYAYEYAPGGTGEIIWYVGDEVTWRLDGRALSPNGNIGQRVVSEEPMALIMNLGMSSSFAALNLTGLASLFPATMRFDYIRIYQDSTGVMTCDPPGYETTPYISQHYKAYNDPNVTNWHDAGFNWPKNTLMNGCRA